MSSKLLFSLAISLLLAPSLTLAKIKLDPDIKKYRKTIRVEGNLDSIGSDTLNNLMTLWAEKFRVLHPDVHIQIEGKGSSTAPPALISGTAQLAPMSRKMKRIEIEKFEKKYGFKPLAIGVALDSLAVYVNIENPIEELSLQEIDAIFSINRKGGYATNIEDWGDVGLTGRWAYKPVSAYGRNSASGTYGYFKKKALFKGDYKPTVKEQPGSASVVMGITEDSYGIGYSGIGYKTAGVKPVAVSKKQGKKAYYPTYSNVLDGSYPLGRMLFVYIIKHPNKEISPLVKEFLKFVLSRQGQKVVLKDGYLPLTNGLIQKSLNKI